MDVNLVVPGAEAGPSGQGRYVDSLRGALLDQGVNARLTPFRYLPGTSRRPILELLPIGVRGAAPGGVHHLVRIKGASMLLLPRRPRPTVVTIHDLGILYCPEDRVLIGSRDRRWGLNLSLAGTRRADHVVAVSDFTRDCLLRAGFDSRRVTTVYEGVDAKRFRPREGAREAIIKRYGFDLPPTHPIVLYVGNELPRKNLLLLVRALAAMRRQGTLFRWIKVGSAAYKPGRAALLRAIEEHGLGADVSIVDHVPEADLPLFYAAASVYAQPSVWEGFGLPVLEAMASGTPVVAAAASSLPEVCGDAAVLVDPRDAAAWTDRLGQLLASEAERGRLRALGLQRAARFTWDAAAGGTVAVYRSVTAPGAADA